MEVTTPETRGRRVRIGPAHPYGGPPEDFFGPGWAVEYTSSGQQHEFFRDDAEPVAVNREPLPHEIEYRKAQEIGES